MTKDEYNSGYARGLEDAAKVAWRYDAFEGCDFICTMDPETGEVPCSLGEEDCTCAMKAEAVSEVEAKIRALPIPPASDAQDDKPRCYCCGERIRPPYRFSHQYPEMEVCGKYPNCSYSGDVPPDQSDALREAYDDLRRYIYDKTPERRERSIERFSKALAQTKPQSGEK